MKGLDAAIKASEALESGDFKTAIEQANILFRSKLNRNAGKIKGRDGGTIQNIDIVDAVKQPDGRFKIPVWVTTDGPSGGYNSFLSEQRGIDPNDPDKVFTAEDLFGTVTAAGSLASIMKSSGIHNQMLDNANRYLSPQGGKGNDVPAEVRSVALLSEMTGYSPEEIVRAKYFSQKDPSGATLQKMAIELAQKDPRLTKIGAKPDQQAINAIVGEYLNMLSKPVSQDELNATNNQGGRTNTPQPVPTPTPAPDAAIQALRQDPSLADEFKAKYNYLPEGF